MNARLLSLCLLASRGNALFQQASNLTLFGVADVGLHLSNNGSNDPKIKLVSGLAEGSRFALFGNKTKILGNTCRASARRLRDLLLTTVILPAPCKLVCGTAFSS